MLARVASAELPMLRSEQAPFFSTDLSVSRDGEGRPALVVTITIPYSELQWVRAPHGYGATVELTVALDPAKHGRTYGGTWKREIVVPSYTASRSPTANLVERDTLDVPPGRYQMRVAVQDLQSESKSSASDKVEIEDWSRVPVGFSDLELGVADSSGAFTVKPERAFGREVKSLAGRAVLFDRRPGNWPRKYAVVIRVRGESGDALVTDERTVTLDASGQPLLLRPSRSDLFVGPYVFAVEMVEGKSHWKVERSFEVEESGPPQGAEWERMLEPLGYVADPGEVEQLRRLPPAQRETGWNDFWRRRDPTPETPRNEALIEFVRRVRYAEDHFQGFGPGWRSDMGRVYIRYGAPDQIESRAATAQSPQLEIWYYNQPYRRLVFADREGFGRFVLVSGGPE
jgi:GWxTD domain-containing protein